MELERAPSGFYALTMRKPFDGHQHFRQDQMLELIAKLVKQRFYGAVAMPNLETPITTTTLMLEYIDELLKQLGADFVLGITLYFTEKLTALEVYRVYVAVQKFKNVHLIGIKYYPRGLTTNSGSGISDPKLLWTVGSNPYNVVRACVELDLAVLIHAANGVDENGEELDAWEQEENFVKNTFPPFDNTHGDVKCSFEHLSTESGAEYMERVGPHGNGRRQCTVTAHHLIADRRDLTRGGLRPDLWCYPAIQPQRHRTAVRTFATAGHSFVALGSDSAGHWRRKKQSACCPGGIFTAHAAIELYAEVFEEMRALANLEKFASLNGPRFYGIKPSEERISLVRNEWKVEQPLTCFKPIEWGGYGIDELTPFRLGGIVRWKLVA